MFTPQDLIGQKVWLEIERESPYGLTEPIKVQAEITQPTSPPWFYGRFLNPPFFLRETGKWLTYQEAERAFLMHPVIDEEDEDFADEDDDLYPDELNPPRW